jgi:hypothetical protein
MALNHPRGGADRESAGGSGPAASAGYTVTATLAAPRARDSCDDNIFSRLHGGCMMARKISSANLQEACDLR